MYSEIKESTVALHWNDNILIHINIYHIYHIYKFMYSETFDRFEISITLRRAQKYGYTGP